MVAKEQNVQVKSGHDYTSQKYVFMLTVYHWEQIFPSYCFSYHLVEQSKLQYRKPIVQLCDLNLQPSDNSLRPLTRSTTAPNKLIYSDTNMVHKSTTTLRLHYFNPLQSMAVTSTYGLFVYQVFSELFLTDSVLYNVPNNSNSFWVWHIKP